MSTRIAIITTDASTHLAWGDRGRLIQYQVITSTTSSANSSPDIPHDNTIPQNTEGKEYFTLAITPTHAANRLEIEVYIPNISVSGDDVIFIGALFQDATANALQAATRVLDDGTQNSSFFLRYHMLAGTTASTTFKFRYGANTGTAYLLTEKGSARFGGIAQAIMTIKEIRT